MPVISFANLKGGSAKTTSAIYLATVLAAKLDLPDITVHDLDEQGSATKWSDFAADDKHPLPFTVSIANIHSLGRLKSSPDSWDIIDCPPGGGGRFDAALDAADLVIVPLSPAGIEAEQMWNTVSTAQSRGATVRVLLANVNLATKSAKALIEALKEYDIPRFETVIPRREAIRNSWALVPDKYFGYDAVAQEMIDVLGRPEPSDK